MSYIEVTGKTEEEALAKALAQLGMDRDDVSVEILERAKSGFLGIGGQPAKIRVSYEGGEDEQPAAAAEEEAPACAEAAPVSAPAEEPEKTETAEPAVSAPAEGEVDDEKAAAIKTFLAGLFEQMDCQAEARVYLQEKGRYKVLLEGKNLGALIGRRGETLDAIQQLTSYAVNRSGGSRIRIQMDAENYRQKREQSLEHLAKKVAGKVVKYRRNVTLEPMNAYERHVIHAALQDRPHVTTFSTGTEPNRRTVVAYDPEKQ